MPMTQALIGAEAAATKEGRRPAVAAPASAAPELAARLHRRVFTAQDTLRILADTDRGADTGGVAAILRREGLCSSTLDWRRQRDAGGFGALTPAERGPKITKPNPLAAEVALLRKENACLALCLKRAEAVMEVQRSCGAAGHPAGARRRRALTDAVAALAPNSGIMAAACAALGASRASMQRRLARGHVRHGR